ncbi:MAG: hypothetical protein H5U40_10010, partial [Polyangiaceae bacterium]|nr:hypothetical protein [Polyangiaceae bacterium]
MGIARAASAALIVLAMLCCSRVEAQGWLSDRKSLEGPGLRVGRLEIHPGVATELGYASNVFLEADDPDDSLILRLSGHVDLATLGSARRIEGEAAPAAPTTLRKLDFRGGVGAAYYDHFNARARDNVEIDAGADAIINPDGRYSFRIANHYGRTIRPFIDATPEGAQVPTYVRNNNTSALTLSIGSRSRLLQGVIGYELSYESFRDAQWDYLDNLTHRVQTRLSW